MGRAAHWHEADLKRAHVATAKAGVRNYRVVIDPNGTISIIVGQAAKAPAQGNSCDDLLS
jgi:hypothetical protein